MVIIMVAMQGMDGVPIQLMGIGAGRFAAGLSVRTNVLFNLVGTGVNYSHSL